MFALAAGALETARLLLVSREGHADGLGNGYDQVGRYCPTHLYGSGAKRRFLGDPSRVGYHFKRSRDGVYVQHMLATRAEVQRDRRLMNFCTVLHYPFLDDPSHGSAILSSVFLAKGLLAHRLPAELFGRALDQKHGSQGSRRFPARMIGRHLRNVATDAGAVPAFAWDWLTRRMLVRRKLPGVKVYSRRGEYDLLYSAEQEPNPDSRVMLSGVPDAFGYSRLRSDWRYTDRDVASIVENHEIIAEDVRGSNNPCVAMDIDRTSLAERIRAGTRLGSHHIGTTRMSQNPRTGVVDEQCRVHGTANLFIAGSGVFPTSSCMSVTLLIVAIAARVADTIAGEFRRQ